MVYSCFRLKTRTPSAFLSCLNPPAAFGSGRTAHRSSRRRVNYEARLRAGFIFCEFLRGHEGSVLVGSTGRPWSLSDRSVRTRQRSVLCNIKVNWLPTLHHTEIISFYCHYCCNIYVLERSVKFFSVWNTRPCVVRAEEYRLFCSQLGGHDVFSSIRFVISRSSPLDPSASSSERRGI
jgi:hypothetical protein